MKEIHTLNSLTGIVREFDELVGRSLCRVERDGDEEIRFYLTESNYVRMYHQQDCCENVYIEDICGDLDDLVGSPLLEAEEVIGYPAGPKYDYTESSYTWTFYKFTTRKGTVTIRWYGTSNGYYSESVSTEAIFRDIGE